MNARKVRGFKTRITGWLLTITLSFAVLYLTNPSFLSSFQPQKNNTEAFWQIGARYSRTAVVYRHHIISIAQAQNKSAVFPPEVLVFYFSNGLVKSKIQHQRKLYVSLKTTLQLCSIGANQQNSEQIPLLS